MQSRRDISLIAASLDLPKALAPHANFVMQWVANLGCFPGDTWMLAHHARIGSKHRVLDLACGKGSNVLSLAALLRCDVTGVDLSKDFIELAQSQEEYWVKTDWPEVRARFKVADVQTFKARRKFDLVLMLNLYPAAKALKVCRRFVKPGGFVIVDDAVRASRSKSRRWPTVDEMRARLESGGCRVIKVRPVKKRRVEQAALEIEEEVRINLRRMVDRRPRLYKPAMEYLARLKRSRKLLTGPLRPTLFLIQVPGKSMQSRPRTDR